MVGKVCTRNVIAYVPDGVIYMLTDFVIIELTTENDNLLPSSDNKRFAYSLHQPLKNVNNLYRNLYSSSAYSRCYLTEIC